jgi:hypothetical protein
MLQLPIMRTPVQFLCSLAMVCLCASARAQYSTKPVEKSEIEAAYTLAIDKRAAAIVTALDLKDPAKAAHVSATLTNHYRSLRHRDELIDQQIKSPAKDSPAKPDRIALFQTMSKPLHDEFLTKLSADLSPDQIETVKNKMTYDKLKVTYDAYCSIIPNLSETDKAKVKDELTLARDEAIDGGSADEKSAIFQKHKDHINDYLNTHGHDVNKAYKEWNAKQDQAKAQEKK